jgi:hypothetical protein
MDLYQIANGGAMLNDFPNAPEVLMKIIAKFSKIKCLPIFKMN